MSLSNTRRLNVPNTYRTPTVTSIGGRDGTVHSADGLIDVQVAVPKEMGGPGGKTNPEELFAAGYAACFHSAMKRVAADRKIAIGKSTVEAHVSLGSTTTAPVSSSPPNCVRPCRERRRPRPHRTWCVGRT
jgi:organic hydroperoxide reductase OsmC/OhrA